MRYVDRSLVNRPPLLEGNDYREAKLNIDNYLDLEPEERQQTRVKFDQRLMRGRQIKDRLFELFEGKCAYCEQSLDGPASAAIEHFRPKRNAGNNMKSTQLEYYSWLVYEWDNLLLSCPICNMNKRSFFPVTGKRGEIGDSIETLRKSEKSLLIDPCYDFPNEHIYFLFDGRVVPRTEKGFKTIGLLKLNRENLIEQRKQGIEALVNRIILDPDIPIERVEIKNTKEQYYFSKIPFSGAITNALTSALDNSSENLSYLLDQLKGLSQEERRQELDSLKSFTARDEYKPGDSGWTFNKAFRDIKKSISSKREYGEVFRSRVLDEMPTAFQDISKIQINNFKILKDIQIILPEKAKTRVSEEKYIDTGLTPCLMILGENATGKSSVLEAIALALIGTKNSGKLNKLIKDDELSPKALIHRPNVNLWSTPTTKKIKISVEFGLSKITSKITGHGNSNSFFGESAASKIVLGYGARRYFDHKTDYNSSVPYRVLSLFSPLATIPDPEKWLLSCNDKDFEAVSRALKEILLLSQKSLVTRNSSEICVELDGTKTPFKHLSVGYKSVLAMSVDIMRELLVHYDNLEDANAVVLIDEIETHLHPRWKMQIMKKLRSALRRVQFIVTTHDPLCLRGMYDNEVVVIAKNEKQDIHIFNDLPPIESMRAEQLLTSDYFGLFSTNPDAEKKFAEYGKLLQLSKSRELTPEEVRAMANYGSLLSALPAGNTLPENIAGKITYDLMSEKDEMPVSLPIEKRSSLKNILSKFKDPEF